jgi:hypothetical protein
MKMQSNNSQRDYAAPTRHSEGGLVASKRSEDGMITLIFIILLSIMMILVMVEVRSLFRLHTEVKWLEHQQINRLNGPPTNPVPNTINP